MDIYTYKVTIKRSDKSTYSYIRGWEGRTEEHSRRKLLNELHHCELQVLSLELREILK